MKRITIEGRFRVRGDLNCLHGMAQPLGLLVLDFPEISSSPRVIEHSIYYEKEKKKPSERIEELIKKILNSDELLINDAAHKRTIESIAIKRYLDELVGEIKS